MSARGVVLGWFVAPLVLVGMFGVALSVFGGDEHTAAVMCEGVVERRNGATEFWDQSEYEVHQTAASEWAVHSAFIEPAAGGQTEFLCTVRDQGDGTWRLVDMTTDRLTATHDWTLTLRAAGFDALAAN